MKLVVDASIALHLAGSTHGFKPLSKYELIAPALLWSESTSVLHRAVWRKMLAVDVALGCLEAIAKAPIKRVNPARLNKASWDVASALGWAKTFDAEYVALAKLNDCQLVTADRRLRRGADRIGNVKLFEEL